MKPRSFDANELLSIEPRAYGAAFMAAAIAALGVLPPPAAVGRLTPALAPKRKKRPSGAEYRPAIPRLPSPVVESRPPPCAAAWSLRTTPSRELTPNESLIFADAET